MHLFEECHVGQIERFGHYEVSRAEIVAFAEMYDPQPFHLSDEGAQANPIFRGISASGWHTAAMAMRMLVDEMKARKRFSLGSPGLDDLQWRVPVYPGDVLSLEMEVLEKSESRTKPHIGFIKYRKTAINQDGESVMSFRSTIIVPRQPADAGAAGEPQAS